MDLTLSILFYGYVGLALSSPLFVIPALVMCRRLSNSYWKAALVCVPWLGLPLFALLIRFPEPSRRRSPALERS
jgi:hypothetical protein